MTFEDLQVGDVVRHKSYLGSRGVVVFTSREPLQVRVWWRALPGVWEAGTGVYPADNPFAVAQWALVPEAKVKAGGHA